MTAKAEEIKKEEAKFLLYELREHARELFGVKPEVFDGVFSKAEETEITKTEAERRIKAFFKKEVK
ncbi:hypothetical protein [Domibacillus iocasae]|uniref:YqzN/YkzM domain-containing protein n=1 Tax=Domibacillus iocasae TaxID=1714016 RepID=A0A1E7DRV3_9BACI|nr:hypothetical protein [Domibacillus iocasae]OES45811.1 hypothetical protein BA724_03125 [Domibacillus iocasae]